MDFLVLAAKSGLALMLVVAGAAKLADLPSFAATVQLFVPVQARARATEILATAIATYELLLGGCSLAFPSIAAINLVVVSTGCAFLAVSSIGYMRHRGMSCRCFGELSRRVFDAAGVIRSLVIVALAVGVAVIAVPPSAIQIGALDHLLLLATAGVVAVATRTAAKNLAVTDQPQPL